MSSEQRATVARGIFAGLLFGLWALETVVWVTSTVTSATKGDAAAVVTAASALALLLVLAGMEGLEVAVIDRWRLLFPGKPTSTLARWLSARQLFVALIVTSATLLARRSSIAVPGVATPITGGVTLDLFDLTWTGFTVLWFGQIAPKALAATNPQRYLDLMRPSLFPLVEFVRVVGVAKPGEWVAGWIADPSRWVASGDDAHPATPTHAADSSAQAWDGLLREQRLDEASHDAKGG